MDRKEVRALIVKTLAEESAGDRPFTTPEAAEHLGISKRHLDELRQRGGGPLFYRVGSRMLYQKRALNAYIDENRARE